MKVEYIPSPAVCSRKIEFELKDDGTISGLHFTGGCPGNLKAIGLMAEGRDAAEVAHLFSGLRCGGKATSCADQLSKAILEKIQKS